MEGHVGMKSENLQEYLNWYACLFWVKQAEERGDPRLQGYFAI